MKTVKSFVTLALITTVVLGLVGCGTKPEPEATAPVSPKGDMPASKSAAAQQPKLMTAPAGAQTGTK